jgi:hypothetical protein
MTVLRTGKGRLQALEPAQMAAFTAFQRAQRPADFGLREDSFAALPLEPRLNVELARRVYDGADGTLDLVPGPDMICCVAINAQTREK